MINLFDPRARIPKELPTQKNFSSVIFCTHYCYVPSVINGSVSCLYVSVCSSSRTMRPIFGKAKIALHTDDNDIRRAILRYSSYLSAGVNSRCKIAICVETVQNILPSSALMRFQAQALKPFSLFEILFDKARYISVLPLPVTPQK